jgi:rhodanese-related sulfurtransferase
MSTISTARTVLPPSVATKSACEIRADLLARREIALLDVREEAAHAEGHPLFAANLSLSWLELEIYARVPRPKTPIVVFDDGEGLAIQAAARLADLGYSDVKLMEGGIQGWRNAGYELFHDVNAPSKAFGELVESQRHTPSLSAQEVKALIDSGADIAIVDVRRFDEFQTMSIPTATSVPGAELVLRIGALARRPETKIIVNCAGRTRSIIGAQSLINAGIRQPVAALRNGTIGWKLAGQTLDLGQSRRFPAADDKAQIDAAIAARRVADRAGVKRIDLETVERWIDRGESTLYRFDVRTPDEYLAGHLPGFRNVPGGQLVQETDMYASVRGASIVLADDRGVRADMTASWLRQMAWDVFVLDFPANGSFSNTYFTERGEWRAPLPALPRLPEGTLISAERLKEWLDRSNWSQQESRGADVRDVVVLDLAPSPQYARSHIPGSWFALRFRLSEAFYAAAGAGRYVLTSSDGVAARFAYAEANKLVSAPVYMLDGGTAEWARSGGELTSADPKYASRPVDRYKRPYEGTDASTSAMQAYLDWESGLVEQLERDATHGFHVI